MQERNNRERKSTTRGKEARERERLRSKRWGSKTQEERDGVGVGADTGASIQIPMHLLDNGKGKSLWARSFQIAVATAHLFADRKLSSGAGGGGAFPRAPEVIMQLPRMRPDCGLRTCPSLSQCVLMLAP